MSPKLNPPDNRPESSHNKETIGHEFKISSASEASVLHPTENQDAHAEGLTSIGSWAVIADGVGGYEGGALASSIVIDLMNETLPANLEGKNSVDEIAQILIRAVYSAHDQIVEYKISQGINMGNPQFTRTTLTTCTLVYAAEINGELKEFIINIGDSRAHLVRNGDIMRTTVDNGMVESFAGYTGVNAETLQNFFSRFDTDTELDYALSERREDLNQELRACGLSIPKDNDQIRALFNRRNIITKSLGGTTSPDIVCMIWSDLQDDDVILLTSDGVTDNEGRFELESDLGLALAYHEVNPAQYLVKQAHEKSKRKTVTGRHMYKPDDVTAVLLQIKAKKVSKKSGKFNFFN